MFDENGNVNPQPRCEWRESKLKRFISRYVHFYKQPQSDYKLHFEVAAASELFKIRFVALNIFGLIFKQIVLVMSAELSTAKRKSVGITT